MKSSQAKSSGSAAKSGAMVSLRLKAQGDYRRSPMSVHGPEVSGQFGHVYAELLARRLLMRPGKRRVHLAQLGFILGA
jgi:hypothetical protein